MYKYILIIAVIICPTIVNAESVRLSFTPPESVSYVAPTVIEAGSYIPATYFTSLPATHFYLSNGTEGYLNDFYLVTASDIAPYTSTIFTDQALPWVIPPADTHTENGVKWTSDVDGYVKGLRVYVPGNAQGVYKGRLWQGSILLASKVISYDPGAVPGWIYVFFDSPVAVTAGVTYTASYHTEGYYHQSNGYFGAVDNGPLHISSTANQNGVYKYGTASQFECSPMPCTPSKSPNSNLNANFWVDVLFAQTIGQCSDAGVTHNTYQLDFPANTYTIWLRGYATAGSDSVLIGIDGSCIGTFQFQSTDQWSWTSTVTEGTNSTGALTAEEHTINLWSVHDGLLIDGVYITTGAETPSDVSHGTELDARTTADHTGYVLYWTPLNVPGATGTITGGSGTTLIDTATDFTSIGAGIGKTVFNTTDETWGVISDITTTTNTNDTLVIEDGMTDSGSNDSSEGWQLQDEGFSKHYDKPSPDGSLTFSIPDSSKGYYMALASFNGAQSTLSNTVYFKPDKPVMIHAVQNGANVELSWDALPGWSGSYNIYRMTASASESDASTVVINTAGSTYNDTPPDTRTYYYVIRGVDTDTITAKSAELSVDYVLPDNTIPDCLTSTVTATATTYQTITLSWDACSDDDLRGYRIYRSLADDITTSSQCILGCSWSHNTLTSFTDVGLNPDTTYYYGVSGYDSFNALSEEINTASATTAVLVPYNYSVLKTAKTITTDGDCSEFAGANVLTWTNIGASEATATIKALQDGNNLYLCLNSTDTEIVNGAETWSGDFWEMNLRTVGDQYSSPLSSTDYKFIISPNENIYYSTFPDAIETADTWSFIDSDYAVVATGGDWTLEIKLAYSDIGDWSPAVNSIVPIGIAYGDKDTSGNCTTTCQELFEDITSSWNDPTLWPLLVIVDEGDETTPPPAVTDFSASKTAGEGSTHSTIDLSWSAVSDPSGVTYVLLRDGGTLTVTTGTSYTDTSGILPSSGHYYEIYPYDGLGNIQSVRDSDYGVSIINQNYTFNCRYADGVSVNAPTTDGDITEWLSVANNGVVIMTDNRGNVITARCLWDTTNLYISFKVANDAYLNYDASQTGSDVSMWGFDHIEIQIDADGDMCGFYTSGVCMDADDHFIGVSMAGGLWTGKGDDSTKVLSSTTMTETSCSGGVGLCVAVDDGTGAGNTINNNADSDDAPYYIEVQIPWADLNTTGFSNKSFRMTMAYSDKYPDATNHMMLGGYTSGSFNNSARFTSAILSGGADTLLPKKPTSIAPQFRSDMTPVFVFSPPDQNEDGSSLTDLAGYKLYRYDTKTAFDLRLHDNVDDITTQGGIVNYTSQLPMGIPHYFCIRAYDTSGNYSEESECFKMTRQGTLKTRSSGTLTVK